MAASKPAPAFKAEDIQSSNIERLAKFRRGLRQFLASSETIAQASGVTSQQYQAMLELKANAGAEMNVGDLAEAMSMYHHSAVQLIDRLEQAGFVARRKSTADARSVLLSLTPSGDATVTQLAEEHLRELRRCEPLLAGALRQLRRIKG